MAEVAAAAVAYEVVETTAQVGVGAYMVAKPTAPLKATFTQIASSAEESTKVSLTRSNHTLSIVKDKAYIFGGETSSGELASNEIRAVRLETSDEFGPDYAIFRVATDEKAGEAPCARKNHAACAFNVCVAIFGGVDESGEVIQESFIWLFNTAESRWEKLEIVDSDAAPKPRTQAWLFNHQNNLVLYGGVDFNGAALNDVWYYSYAGRTWTQLPNAPVSSSNVSLSDGVLYVVSGSDSVSGDVHTLHITGKENEQNSWDTISFPANPLTPGPAARTGAGLMPVSTGYGRQYLLYMFGAQPDEATSAAEPSSTTEPTPRQYWSDMWTFQLPSSTPSAKPTTNFYDAVKPAKIKDAIRSAIGVESGKHSWFEVEVLPPTDLDESAGKVHPGPRSGFACDVMKDGRTVIIWGGVNPKGEREGDGWIIKLE